MSAAITRKRVAKGTAGVSPKTIARHEMAVRALALAKAGFSWVRIAEECGYRNRNLAKAAVAKLVQAERIEASEDWHAMQIVRHEDMLMKMQTGISRGNPRAVEVALKVLDQESRLLDLYPDARRDRDGTIQAVQINILPHPNDDAARTFLEEVQRRAQLAANGAEPAPAIAGRQPEVQRALPPPIEGTLLPEVDNGSGGGDG